MLVKLTRGIGGPKGLLVLVLTVALGLLLVLGGVWLRHRMLAPKGVIATTVPPEKVLALGDKARGSSVQVPLAPGELARVTSYAAARQADNQWAGLAEGLILKVTSSAAIEGEMWVTGGVEGGPRLEPVTVHASFLERYKPVVLDNLMELSDVRLSTFRDGPNQGTAVTGCLRNRSSRTISQCVVSCVFQDLREREVDLRRSVATTLPPGELVRFQTERSEKPFDSISVQIMYATPDGLRDYLSTVVIKKSSLQ